MSAAQRSYSTSTNLHADSWWSSSLTHLTQEALSNSDFEASATTEELSIRHAQSSWQRSALKSKELANLYNSNGKPLSSFIAEQEWEGEVISISEDKFIARLYDLTHTEKTTTQEESEFETREISESDLSLLKEGAIFRWSLGFSRSISGTRERTSRLVFRRLPAWTRKEIMDSRAEAENLLSQIEWDDE